MSAPTIRPVYEFRPLPGFFRGAFRRLSGDVLIPDDGEYGLAFAGDAESGEHWTFPCALYVSLPHHRNILWSHLPGPWTAFVAAHPRGNPWHYEIAAGTSEWGGGWGRDNHPNAKAGDRAMGLLSSECGCANGRHVEFHPTDSHIRAGLVRDAETRAVVVAPDHINCMYCGRLEVTPRLAMTSGSGP